MHFLSRLRDLCTDFLFPKSRKVLELEALSVGTLLKTLPPAEHSREKDTIALFSYSHPLVKEIIWELKYNGNARITGKLGEILYDHIRQELLDLALFEKWGRPTSSGQRPTSSSRRLILIPIPISDKRRFERGWNQSELLCEQVLTHDNEKTFRYLPRQLAKLHHTESQTKTSTRNERLENIKNSMKVLNASAIAGECIVVLDDVTTTGSTFAEARRALRAAGARKILCVAVAH